MNLSISLPDEIVKEILSPVLNVPDETFASTSWVSPFSHYELTTSTVLAQAQALARTLKENAQLSRFVRRFRIEGRFGIAIYDILKRTPEITDFCISGALKSSESVGGYLRGLRLVNLQRLVYFKDRTDYSANKNQKEIGKALAESIRDAWTSLVSMSSVWLFSTAVHIAHALQARSLTDLVVESDELCDSDPLKALAGLLSLRVISITGEDFDKPSFETLVERDYSFADPISRITKVALYQFLAQSRTIYNKLVFPRYVQVPENEVKRAGPFQSLPISSHYKPLSGVTCDVRATIWTQILRFAMELDDINEITGVPFSVQRRALQGLDERRRTQAFQANLTLVSKEFNAITTPLPYEAPTISKSRVFESLAQSQRKGLIKIICLGLFHDPSKVRLVRRLVDGCSALTSLCASGAIYSRGSGPLLTLTAVSPFARTPALPILYSSLGTASSTLQHLHLPLGLRLSRDDFDAIVMREFAALGQLQRLKSLVLALAIQGPVPRSTITGPTLCLDKDCLPQLQCLGIEGVGSPLFENVLECLSTVKFPSLKRFDVEGTHSSCVHTFLKTHGHKLVVLKAALSIRALFSSACPNVSQWIIDDDGGRSSRSFRVGYDFSCLTSVPEGAESALQTITIIGDYHEHKALEGLLQVDFPSVAPKLESIKVAGIQWPTNQHEIEASGWVSLAETLWEWFGVKLVDWHSKWWAPRLKVQSSKKKS
ncbi:hypothetical protein BKA70DRAFT_1480601 [Coprinopsis sp. MPI-PUGE-AT-0042]|nr:hypothetical protein BKA70DRAFT_1480601 [Coprinopsis sp. MPI-PUGE-AT-0042]